MEQQKTPLWFKILALVLMLPVFGLPTLLSGLDGAENAVRLLVWLYPAYVILSGICALLCYRSRPELAWILLILMLLSHAGVYYLALH